MSYFNVQRHTAPTAPFNSVFGVMIKWYNDSSHDEVEHAMKFLEIRVDLIKWFVTVKIHFNTQKINELLNRMGEHVYNERNKR